MEEKQVTVDGKSHSVQKPFLVIATQNPAGTAGTQLLPQAQLDRFLVRLSIGHPSLDMLVEILRDRQTENPLDTMRQILDREEVLAMQPFARFIPVMRSCAIWGAWQRRPTRTKCSLWDSARAA